MTNNPLVSVIVPTYNRACTIERAINSILNQTYTNFELIVVDDGSTDNTSELINLYRNDRIICIRNKNNSGQAAARNIGLKRVNGEYIAFLDSDDEWHSDYLKKQVEVMNALTDEYGLVYCKCKRLVNDKVSFIPSKIIREDDVKSELLKENFITLAVLLKKKYLEKCGYLDEKMLALEDWDFFIRLSNICKFKYNDKTLVTIYASKDGINDNIANRIMAREYILEKNKDALRVYPEVLSNHYYILATEFGFLKDKANAIKYCKKSLRLNSKDIDSYLILFFAILNIYSLVLFTKLRIKVKNLFK